MGSQGMGLTRKGKVLLTSVGVLLAISSILAIAISLERKHQLGLPPEKSGLERLRDISDSLGRARKRMLELIEASSERTKREAGIITRLVNSVNHLSKSLTDFAKELKQTGFSNILSRYEEDLKNFTLVLKEIEANNGTIGRENLERVKIIEELFFEDETDLMNTETITSDQAEEAQTLVESLEETENLTQTVCGTIEEVIKTEDTTSISTTQTVGNTTESEDTTLESTINLSTISEDISESQDSLNSSSTQSLVDDMSVTERTSESVSEITTESETETEGSGMAESDRDFSGMAGFPLILFDL